MGTRAQVFFPKTGVYLYQHYDGDGLYDTVKAAVMSSVGQNRKNDAEYLARIVFCAMVHDYIDGETGYGINTYKHGDIEYLVTVDTENCTIKECKVYDDKITRSDKF